MANRTLTDTSTITQDIATANVVKLNVVALGTPSSGTLTNCTGLPIAGTTGYGTGVAAALAINATGSAGGFARATSPTFVTPTLGAATATSVNKMAITAPATSSTLAVADGKTLTSSNTLTLAGTDGKTLTLTNGLTVSGNDGTVSFGAASKTLTVSNSGTLAGGDSFTLAIAASKTLTCSNTLTFAGTDGSTLNIGTGGTLAAVATSGSATDLGSGTLATARLPSNQIIVGIEFLIDGSGSTITTGLKGYLEVPFACTITQATLLGDQSGSIVVNIWKCTYAQFDAGSTHPVATDKITASAPPTISSATKAQDSTLTGWTTSLSAGDILAFNVDSITTLQRVTLSLKVNKT